MININKKQTKHLIIQIILFIVLIAADQLIKLAVVLSLKGNSPVVLIDGVLELRYLENFGAAFGMLQNSLWIFYVITVIAVAVFVFLWVSIRKNIRKYGFLCAENPDVYNKKTYNHAAASTYLLIILAAGAIGNFIDRIFNGYVVDYIYFRLIDFPIFNFADICVTCSAIGLIIFFLFIYKEDKNLPLVSFKSK